MIGSVNDPDTTVFKIDQLVMGDPLLRWLTKRNVHPALFGIAYSVLLQCVRAFITGLVGHLRTVGNVTGYLDNPALYTNVFFGAVVTGYYVWLPKGIMAVFEGLFSNGVIGAPISRRSKRQGKTIMYSYRSFFDDLRASFSPPWWYIIPLAVTIAATITLILPTYLETARFSADRADPVSFALTVLWVFLGLYFVLQALAYCTLTIYWLSRLFSSFRIEVRPLHPDRAGGLSPLGRFTLSLSYAIALIGIILVVTPITRNYVVAHTWQFRWTSELVVGLVVYALVAPVVFFAPLSVAHNSMKEAKEELLNKVARQFDKEYTKVREALGGQTFDLEKSSKILKELRELHDMAHKFPVWPFNATNMTRFGTSYVAPVALAVIIDLVTRLIGI